MAVRRLAEVQPASFAFTPENKAWCEGQIAKYPPGRQASAIIPLLWQAQKQNNYWLSKPAIETVADMLGMPHIRALEIATFYSMFNLEPVGRYFVQLCGTTPCMLRGAEEIKKVCERRIGEQRHVTADGIFSWLEVECLGACCNAPMVQINDDYYEDLTPENFDRLLDDLAAGRPVHVGSQTGRVSSEPTGGLTSLQSLYGVDGRSGRGSQPAQPSPGAPLRAAQEKARQDAAGTPRSASEALQQIDAETPGRPPNTVPGSQGHTDVPLGSHDDGAKGPQGVASPQGNGPDKQG